MKKFTINLSDAEASKLDLLGAEFGPTWAAVLRRAINLLLLYVEVREKKQNLCVVDESGKIVERVRIL